jgi:hypothetical protein
VPRREVSVNRAPTSYDDDITVRVDYMPNADYQSSAKRRRASSLDDQCPPGKTFPNDFCFFYNVGV